jgi:excisionase family DNA binding protein
MQPGDWLTAAESAAILGVSAKRVHALIRVGRLSSTRVGNQFLLLRSDVVAFSKLPRMPGRPAAKKAATRKKGKK